MQTIWLD